MCRPLVAGEWAGKGVLRTPDGGVYEGEFAHGRKHGRGVHRLASGNVYEGDFVEDARQGGGIVTFAGTAAHACARRGTPVRAPSSHRHPHPN